MSANIHRNWGQNWCKRCSQCPVWPSLEKEPLSSINFLSLAVFSHSLPTLTHIHAQQLSQTRTHVNTQAHKCGCMYAYTHANLSQWVSITFISPSTCVGVQQCILYYSPVHAELLYCRPKDPDSVCRRAEKEKSFLLNDFQLIKYPYVLL